MFVHRYLQEIGYTDTIIDVRSARVRSLLGLQPVAGDNENDGQPALVNGEQQPGKRDSQGKRYVKLLLKMVVGVVVVVIVMMMMQMRRRFLPIFV